MKLCPKSNGESLSTLEGDVMKTKFSKDHSGHGPEEKLNGVAGVCNQHGKVG
jgi:hypothetical protein